VQIPQEPRELGSSLLLLFSFRQDLLDAILFRLPTLCYDSGCVFSSDILDINWTAYNLLSSSLAQQCLSLTHCDLYCITLAFAQIKDWLRVKLQVVLVQMKTLINVQGVRDALSPSRKIDRKFILREDLRADDVDRVPATTPSFDVGGSAAI